MQLRLSMSFLSLRFVTFGLLAAAAMTASDAFSQGSDPAKAAQPPAPAQTESQRNGPPQRRLDEIVEVGKSLTGPAANPECFWLGRRVVGLLWRDDLDTAFRHLDLYDRFGCPGGHIQATFRCVIRTGNPDGGRPGGTEADPKKEAQDPKKESPETLNKRVQDCWINPALQPAPQPAAAAPAPPSGTTTR
jgi:hypothetical protein